MFKSEDIQQMVEEVEVHIEHKLKDVDKRIDSNQWKVLEVFQKHQVSDFHFNDSTGYGYNDRGREVLDQVYADVFGAESAIVRPHFVSGTHTINTALFGLLRPGDHLLFITGKPYDTLHNVIGKPDDGLGSLQDYGIKYNAVDLLAGGSLNWEEIIKNINNQTKVIGIQRSRGYEWRSAFSIKEIEKMISKIKTINPELIVFVDNCYGEFTETFEPTHVGADLIAGSLIKNPGGGIASSGGYIAGKKKYVDLASYRLTAPGIGGEVGAMLGTTRTMFQGLFLAPHFVGQALKGSIFAASMFEKIGFITHPNWKDTRSDLIQAIQFENSEQLISFVQSIQKASPVDAHVVPVPWEMPGYDHPIIMGAGTFIQGGSLELSADGPIRPPYIAYMQGGLTYSHCKFAVIKAVKDMLYLVKS
ncbi:aminotransferase class I/II-fold pyridoxal phosphate-dependent enzyme [Chengkuizengella sediminis]|uniref:methionine gamma-lyase family protein n=1 Tax=Chengkuizengella sediminis TaxID=1885917 RepID=UPI00138A49B4|nr:methionine gamma-lyase family protein [Chengkuizengella sediminis]NDI34526.1 hypothetical protein [Chengkuizengella sediminis]